MPLTEKQRNVVIITYYIAMLDMLATIAGITSGAGKEGNLFFNWMTPLSMMYVTMFVGNVAVFLFIIYYMNYLNNSEKETLSKYKLSGAFANALLAVMILRFAAGPLLWLIIMCGVPI